MGTNLDHHFSWCFDLFVEDVLRVVNFSHGGEGGCLILDTYIKFGQPREHWFEHLDVTILRMIGHTVHLGERPIHEVFR